MAGIQTAPSVRRQPAASFLTAVMAVGGCAGFYLIAPRLPVIAPFVQRYFCSHPLEYISTLMFFTGLAILFRKVTRLRAERTMLVAATEATTSVLRGSGSETAAQRDQEVQAWCDELPFRLRSTQLFHRIQDTLHYLNGSRRDGLEDHLRYLAELAGERLHQTYATIRTVTWAIPILGFLGTVMGITMAIANVTPEQLDSSLGEVTGGLAVAFDTTALALGMSIVLVFSSFIVERSEQEVLNNVEQFGIDILLPWFAVPATDAQQPNSFSSDQTEIWSEHLDNVRTVWTGLLSDHAETVQAALNSQLHQTLQVHREGADSTRDAYAKALEGSTEAVFRQTERLLAAFDDRVSAWQEAMCVSSQTAARQTEAIHDLGATLLRMTEAEERLTALQQQLNDNLQALQIADTMEQTANSIAAAVHVLTAKTSMRTAA